MLLSEAILKGSELRPQAFGEYFGEEDTELNEEAEPELCSCVLGAAFEAVAGGPPYFAEAAIPCTLVYLQDEFPILKKEDVVCPACGDKDFFFLFNVLTHLNDNHRWTREEIAAWVQTIET